MLYYDETISVGHTTITIMKKDNYCDIADQQYNQILSRYQLYTS